MSDAELRAMVRDVLREALAGRAGRNAPPPAVPAGKTAPTSETVAIASDADLAGFVRRLVTLMDNPASAAALRSGQLKFTLAGGRKPATQAAAAVPQVNGASVVLDGTVTEAKINKCAGAGSVMLAPDAVITPLARDRARMLGLKIERKR